MLLSGFIKLITNGKEANVQNPLPVDGDSVHAKDIDIERCDLFGFDGFATDFFDNLHSENKDESNTNPKKILIHLHRTTICPLIALGSSEGGSFSNVKVIGILSGGIETVLADYTDNSTPKTTQVFQFPNTGINAFRLEFHTANAVAITNIYIPKLVSVASIPETSVVYGTSYKSPYLLNGGSQAMNVAGSLVAPIDFEYTVTGFASAKWQRSFIDLADGVTEFLPDNFGALSALTNGVQIIAVKDGVETIIETWKTNMDISMTMYDFSSPFKVGAYIGRWTIKSDLGSPITLFPNDKIIVRIQDTLTGLDSFRLRLKLKQ